MCCEPDVCQHPLRSSSPGSLHATRLWRAAPLPAAPLPPTLAPLNAHLRLASALSLRRQSKRFRQLVRRAHARDRRRQRRLCGALRCRRRRGGRRLPGGAICCGGHSGCRAVLLTAISTLAALVPLLCPLLLLLRALLVLAINLAAKQCGIAAQGGCSSRTLRTDARRRRQVRLGCCGGGVCGGSSCGGLGRRRPQRLLALGHEGWVQRLPLLLLQAVPTGAAVIKAHRKLAAAGA